VVYAAKAYERKLRRKYGRNGFEDYLKIIYSISSLNILNNKN
jgi:hypothetical protein